jgi:hypothetical protein
MHILSVNPAGHHRAAMPSRPEMPGGTSRVAISFVLAQAPACGQVVLQEALLQHAPRA